MSPPFGGQGGFPADFIAEGVDQTRGWFYTLHAIATMCFDSVAYKNVVSNGLVFAMMATIRLVFGVTLTRQVCMDRNGFGAFTMYEIVSPAAPLPTMIAS